MNKLILFDRYFIKLLSVFESQLIFHLTKKCWKGYDILSPVLRGRGSKREKGWWRTKFIQFKERVSALLGRCTYINVWFGRRDLNIIVPGDCGIIYIYSSGGPVQYELYSLILHPTSFFDNSVSCSRNHE